eukprot:g9462.t1
MVASSSCVDVEIICTPGSYSSEITWEIKKQDNTILIIGGGGETKSTCLPYGTLTLVGKDSYGDGWNGATIKVIGDDETVYLAEWSGPSFSEETKTFNILMPSGVCPIGSYGIINCTNCSIGKFGNEKGRIDESGACPYNTSTCPLGHFCQHDRVAHPCPIGSFNNVTGQTACKTCLSGYVALSNGSTSCSICDRGSYCPSATSQKLCPMGTFNNVTGQTACKTCLSGYVAFQDGSIDCSECPTAYYCPSPTSYFGCPIGTYNNLTGQASKESCKVCMIGYVATVDFMSNCWECRKGFYCPDAMSEISCPIGTYNNLTGQVSKESCKVCMVGLVAPNEGMSDCACPDGKYKNTTGLITETDPCLACPARKVCRYGKIMPEWDCTSTSGSFALSHDCNFYNFNIELPETSSLELFGLSNTTTLSKIIGGVIVAKGNIYVEHVNRTAGRFIIEGIATFRNCLFFYNTIDNDNGGALCITSGEVTLNDCSFLENYAKITIFQGSGGYGGALYIDGSATLNNCSIVGNSAMQGGGLYVDISGEATLNDCYIAENRALTSNLMGGGGGLMILGDVTIKNCIIAGNTAVEGDGDVSKNQVNTNGLTIM